MKLKRRLYVVVFRMACLLLAVQGFSQTGSYDWNTATELRSGIRRAQVSVSDPRPMKINAVRVDLTHPQIRFYTTPRHANWGQPCPDYEQYTIETGRQKTSDFLTQSRGAGMDMQVAVNGSGWAPWAELSTIGEVTYAYADLRGLAVSDGQLVSPGDGTRPSVVFYNDWSVGIQTLPAGADISNIQVAVPANFVVVAAGVPSGSTTDPQPRTGYGFSADGNYLYLMTIDGRQSGYSEGATPYEVGQWLAYFGSWSGLNMDGGGSTTLAAYNGTVSVLNSPSEFWGARAVGNNLGVYYDTRLAALARSPASLPDSAPRNQSSFAGESIEVWNSGGSMLSYSVSSDASWLSVASSSGTSKGEHDALQLLYDTTAMSTGTYSATLTISDLDAGSPPQAVAVALTVTPAPEELPISESFESYAPGTQVSGTGAWSGTADEGTVTEATYVPPIPPGYPLPDVSHSNVLDIIDTLQHKVSAAQERTLNVDLMINPYHGDPPNDWYEPVQAAFLVNTQGLFQVWHLWFNGTVWTQRWSVLDHPSVGTDEWVRLSVALDYGSSSSGDTFFQPRVNGSLCPTAYGFKSPVDWTSPGSWYLCADSPGRGGAGTNCLTWIKVTGSTLLDDLRGSTAAFTHTGPTETNGVPFAWFDAMGIARDPYRPAAGEGLTAEDAYVAGIDPTDPEGSFRMVSTRVENGQVVVEFTGNNSGSQTPYILEWPDNLVSNDWKTADSAVPRASAPAKTTQWIGSEPAGKAFFRAKAMP